MVTKYRFNDSELRFKQAIEAEPCYTFDIVSDFLSAVVEIYKTEQKGLRGITTIGNPIRYSKDIKKIFSYQNGFAKIFEERLIVRATRNRNELINLLLQCAETARHEKLKVIDFIVFSSDLIRESSIVDKSSISLEDCNNELKKFLTYFQFRGGSLEINIFQIERVPGYSFQRDENYTRIIPVNDVRNS